MKDDGSRMLPTGMGIQRQFDCRAKLIRHDANASGRQGRFH